MPGTIVIAKSLFAAKYEEQLLGIRKEFGFLRTSVRKCAQSAGKSNRTIRLLLSSTTPT